MGVALYRKYRSRSLADIAGQKHVTSLLTNAIKNDKVAHAYLFTGPRGVGKTSIARILAHEINEIEYQDESVHLDIIEIDAASNNGVEDIRDLRDRVQTAPVSAKKKIYIIDEVHMLSKQAFNALLKTLEEPPEHVVFILATTDIDKVPETIISRTQRHTFKRASEQDIVGNLKRIADGEAVDADEDALLLIARHSDGSFRDSVSLFDQIVSGTSGKSVTTADVTVSLGLVESDVLRKLLDETLAGNVAEINSLLLELESNGVPSRTVSSQLTDILRRDIASNPGYASLIDNLLDVSKSQYPELKLLTTLSLYASSSFEVTSHPVPRVEPNVVTETLHVAPEKPAQLNKATPELKTAPKKTETRAAQTTPTKKKLINVATGDFDWNALVQHARTNHVAVYSVLSKCEHEVTDGTLKLYTKSAFYKKKLDEVRYKQLIIDSLNELGYDYEVETVAEAMPLKDSHAAQVAAIMGGGEEVSVDDA